LLKQKKNSAIKRTWIKFDKKKKKKEIIKQNQFLNSQQIKGLLFNFERLKSIIGVKLKRHINFIDHPR
jgi:hypothetical protein